MMTEAEHLSGAEIKFTILKDRSEEVKTAMRNGSNCCYLIFDRNSGSFLRSESSEIGNWVIVEMYTPCLISGSSTIIITTLLLYYWEQ